MCLSSIGFKARIYGSLSLYLQPPFPFLNFSLLLLLTESTRYCNCSQFKQAVLLSDQVSNCRFQKTSPPLLLFCKCVSLGWVGYILRGENDFKNVSGCVCQIGERTTIFDSG